MRDDRILYSLACDRCGLPYPAGPHAEGDAVDLWLSAYRRGWRLARGAGIEFAHFCPACSSLPSGSE